MKDYLMHQIEYKKYVSQVVDKEQGKGQVQWRVNKKAEADKIVSQVLVACWDDSSSDLNDPK